MQQVPPQAAWPAGQHMLFAPQEPPALEEPVPGPQTPELGLHTQTVRESPACIAMLLLGALNPLIEIELSAHDITVKPAKLGFEGVKFKEFPACHVGVAFWS